jgi:hypothetical protein
MYNCNCLFEKKKTCQQNLLIQHFPFGLFDDRGVFCQKIDPFSYEFFFPCGRKPWRSNGFKNET